MKAKVLVLGLCGAMLLSSCGTTGGGAIAGGYLGGAFGSAVGGIFGGYRGHEVGKVIGMATGAIAGAAAEKAEADKRERKIQEYHDRIAAREPYMQNNAQHYHAPQHDDSGFDETNSGDDRLYDFGSPDYGTRDSYASIYAIDIRHAHFVGEAPQGVLSRKNPGKIVFEIKNAGSRTLYDIVPTVVETTGNKKIIISQSTRIEAILPGQTLRYTAMVKPIRTLRNGVAEFDISVMHGNRTISRVVTLGVKTEK